MATIIFGPSPVTLKAGTPVTASVEILDNVESVVAELAHWTNANTATLVVEVSFDGGVTWVQRAVDGPSIAPSGTFKNRTGLLAGFKPTWRKCGFVFPVGSRYKPGQMCGELYYNGWPPQTQVHSDYAFEPSAVIAATPFSAITFHDPQLNQMVGPPRQVRATLTASGNISSQLTVTTEP